MRVTIAAIGRAKTGPEAALTSDYISRFNRTGKALGLGPCVIVEREDRKKGGRAAEGALLLDALPGGARVIALDERGRSFTSREFATQLAKWRDDGLRDCAFVIGGADGLGSAVRDRADLSISFGKMVWPHMLARVMLTEQLYRAATILSGSPYHRD